MNTVYCLLVLLSSLVGVNLYARDTLENTICLEHLDENVFDCFRRVGDREWSEQDHQGLAYILYNFGVHDAEISLDMFISALHSVKSILGDSACDDLYEQLTENERLLSCVDAQEVSPTRQYRNPALADRTAIVNIIMGNQAEIKIQELAANGTNTASIQAPGDLAANYTLTLPINAGTLAGQVLTTDGLGALSWVTVAGGGDIVNNGQTGPITIGTNDATPLELETNGTSRLFIDASGNTTYTTNYKANARVGVNQSIVGAGTQTIQFNTITYDPNNNFNTGTFLYTAPVTGYYYVTVNLSATYSNNSIRTLNLLRNGVTVTGYSNQSDRRDAKSFSSIIDLTAGDTLGAQLVNNGGNVVILANGTSMIIHFISR